jgi:transcriptional regulator with XRE-family HTH domain
MPQNLESTSKLRVIRSDNASGVEAGGWRSIGSRVRGVRKAKGWSLAKLCSESGIPQSTLSKFENDSLSLPLDRIFRLGDALGIAVTEMFDASPAEQSLDAPGRRSIARAGEGRATATGTYDRRWLFADLIQKRMYPVLQTVLARDIEEFGPLLRHEGEEFAIVLKGRVQVVTDIYEPVDLEEMDGIYIDSRMGHAYLNAGDDEAVVLNVSTSVHHAESDSAKPVSMGD